MSLEIHSKKVVVITYKILLSSSLLCKMIIHAFISPCLQYWKIMFSCSNKEFLDCLLSVQNAVSRLSPRTRKRDHKVLASLHWLPFHFRIQFRILVLTLRELHGQTPKYVMDLQESVSSSQHLRSSVQMLLVVYQTHFENHGEPRRCTFETPSNFLCDMQYPLTLLKLWVVFL